MLSMHSTQSLPIPPTNGIIKTIMVSFQKEKIATSGLLHIPRPSIAQRAPTRTLARTPKLRRQTLRRYLLQQRLPHSLLIPADNLDLGNRHGVQPSLDDIPSPREHHRRVDDVELAHSLWIVVLPDVGGFCDVVGYVVERQETDVVQVQDRCAGFNGITDGFGACWESIVGELLVLFHEGLDLPVFVRNLL